MPFRDGKVSNEVEAIHDGDCWIGYLLAKTSEVTSGE